MRVLFDNNVDQRFSGLLGDHEVVAARTMGWSELGNGDLIAAADAAGFAVLVTADKNLRHQQTLKGRKLCVIVLASHFVDFVGIAPLADKVLEALEQIVESSFIVVEP